LPEVTWRARLVKPAAESVVITSVAQPEEAVIGD